MSVLQCFFSPLITGPSWNHWFSLLAPQRYWQTHAGDNEWRAPQKSHYRQVTYLSKWHRIFSLTPSSLHTLLCNREEELFEDKWSFHSSFRFETYYQSSQYLYLLRMKGWYSTAEIHLVVWRMGKTIFYFAVYFKPNHVSQ